MLSAINHPVIYRRNYENDVPAPKTPSVVQRAVSIARAALPLAMTFEAVRKPLASCLGVVRSLTHLTKIFTKLEERKYLSGLHHFFQTTLSVCSVVLLFFTPGLSFILSSLGDFIQNSKRFVQGLIKGDFQKAFEGLANMALDAVFITALLYAAIELTVLCMALQIAFALYTAGKHLARGESIEAILTALFAGAFGIRLVPQVKLMNWKWKNSDVLFEAALMQDKKGFVYLKMDDERLYELFELYRENGMELPPYFGKGRAGGHVSVIMPGEWNGERLAEVGQKFTFRIHGVDSITPAGWKGVDKVWFVTMQSPELEALREKYGLPSRIGGDHDFHFTFAIS